MNDTYIDNVKDTVIFQGMSEEEISDALNGLDAFTKSYTKGTTIMHSGFSTKCMGLVLEGSVTIESNDLWGNKTILSHVEKRQFFAETYGFLADELMLVDVVANEDCRILFLAIGNLRSSLSLQEPWVAKIISNLLNISTHKNLLLSGRSFHTSPKTIRGRLISYLSSLSVKTGFTEFDIPFNRQQLADYLNVERTALSKELRKMKDDGLIAFHKNHFVLKEQLGM